MPVRPAPVAGEPHDRSDWILHADGTYTAQLADGTQVVRAPDGSCWSIDRRGCLMHTWREEHSVRHPSARPVAVTQPDGGVVMYRADGSHELWYDSVCAMVFGPDGRPLAAARHGRPPGDLAVDGTRHSVE